eukprot:s979_g16.t1
MTGHEIRASSAKKSSNLTKSDRGPASGRSRAPGPSGGATILVKPGAVAVEVSQGSTSDRIPKLNNLRGGGVNPALGAGA